MRSGLWVLWALAAASIPALVGVATPQPAMGAISQTLWLLIITVALGLRVGAKLRARESVRSGFDGLVEPYNEFYLARTTRAAEAGTVAPPTATLMVDRAESLLREEEPDPFHLGPKVPS